MKKYGQAAAFLVISLFAFALLQSCKEDSTNPSDEYDQEIYTIEDSEQMSEVEVIDATLTIEMSVYMYEMDNDSDGQGSEIKSKKPNRGNHFGFFFRKLNLSNTQKAQLKDYMMDYRDCVKDNRKDIFQAVKVILAKARLDRKVVVDAYKDGEMTKSQAEAEIAIINAQTRMELQTDDTIDMAIENIRNCRKNLIDNIRAMLNEDQREEFDDLLD